MIIVYASSKGLTPKLRAKLNSFKAQTQPRRKDGRFAKSLPKPSDVEKNPLVHFTYPSSETPWHMPERTVRLISVTDKYITGLERNGKGWKYKKFLKGKARQLNIVSFNPASMS